MNAGRWEYKSFHFTGVSFLSGKPDTEELDRILNDLGREGWELASTGPHHTRLGRGHGLIVMLKRPR